MGFRFRKSINLGKGFRINLSKSGIGASWGIKGLRFTRTAKGKTRATVSLPGTGLSYSTELGGKKKEKEQDEKDERVTTRDEDDRPIGETEEMTTPREEEEDEGIGLLELILIIGLWLLTAFYAVLAAVNIPETVGFVALATAAVMLPVGIWQDFLSRFVKGWLKVVVAIALAVVTLVMGPFQAFGKWLPAEETEPATTAVVQQTTQAAGQTSVAMDYVLNTGSKKFHLPDCSSVSGMKESNREDFHGTREELLEQNYEPCGNCKP